MQKIDVLVVDDNPVDLEINVKMLKSEFSVEKAASGLQALQLCGGSLEPEVVVLDVMMPDMDGIECARQLKANAETKDIEVIFVSGAHSLEEIMAGYEAGCSDYLIKPAKKDELVQKVRLLKQNLAIRQQLAAEREDAFKTALTAMTNAGEQGVVLDFLRNSFLIEDHHGLARHVLDTLQRYDLHSTIQIHTPNEILVDGMCMPVPPIEVNLLDLMKDQGRVFEKGPRAFFNSGPISVLIKNMPDDEEHRGRLRDHISILMEGAESKMRALNMQVQLKSLLKDSIASLEAIEHEQAEHAVKNQDIVEEMLQELEASFLAYGLSEEQETMLFGVIQKGVDRSLANFNEGLASDQRMQEIISRLSSLASH